jgi:uncharacterized membrane protein YhaH (DUF805 family)
MNWREYLFSFRGRINRAKYWLFVLVGFLFIAGMVAVALPYILIEHPSTNAPSHGISLLLGITIIAEIIVFFTYLFATLAIVVKRLHDRNKSGWWAIVFLVLPSIFNVIGRAGSNAGAEALFGLIAFGLSIWGFVEIGCLRGTDGTNKYGYDPLGSTAAEADVFA